MESTQQAHRANRSTQFFYGFGSIAVGIKNNLLGTFLLIYYNQVLGLDNIIGCLLILIGVLFSQILPLSNSKVKNI